MAMTMTGEVALPANRTRVWASLDGSKILKAGVPGRQPPDKTGDACFAAPARVKVAVVAVSVSDKVLANFAATRSAPAPI